MWLTIDDVEAMSDDPNRRLTQILVRCGGCRFVAAAQDVAHIVSAIEAAGDYVRDFSLPYRSQ